MLSYKRSIRGLWLFAFVKLVVGSILLLFSTGNVLAVPCSVGTGYYFDSNAEASQACNADRDSASCETYENDSCSHIAAGDYYYFSTRDIYLGWTLHRYYYVSCGDGQSVDYYTGECGTDKKNLGCDEPCGHGTSPMVGE